MLAMKSSTDVEVAEPRQECVKSMIASPQSTPSFVVVLKSKWPVFEAMVMVTFSGKR
jgi:hypothetical protein